MRSHSVVLDLVSAANKRPQVVSRVQVQTMKIKMEESSDQYCTNSANMPICVSQGPWSLLTAYQYTLSRWFSTAFPTDRPDPTSSEEVETIILLLMFLVLLS